MARDPDKTLCLGCQRPTESRCEICGDDLCGMCGHRLDAYSHVCARCVVEEFPEVVKALVAEHEAAKRAEAHENRW